MGRWAQARRRGGGGSQAAPLESPVLTALGEPEISWTFGGDLPDLWDVYASVVIEGPYVLDDSIPGGDSLYGNALNGLFYYVIGATFAHAPVTGQSNIVLQTP